jgi:PhnB protein
MFHLHEENPAKGKYSPLTLRGTTSSIGLFVPSVDKVMKKALDAGAKEISPVQSYDYGYRQGEIIDPFGHLWLIEMKI